MNWYRTGKDEKVISCTEESSLHAYEIFDRIPCARCGSPIMRDDTVREIMMDEAKLYIVCK